MGWRLKVSLERDDQDGLAVPSLGILSVGTAGQWWSTVNKEQSRKGRKRKQEEKRLATFWNHGQEAFYQEPLLWKHSDAII